MKEADKIQKQNEIRLFLRDKNKVPISSICRTLGISSEVFDNLTKDMYDIYEVDRGKICLIKLLR